MTTELITLSFSTLIYSASSWFQSYLIDWLTPTSKEPSLPYYLTYSLDGEDMGSRISGKVIWA